MSKRWPGARLLRIWGAMLSIMLLCVPLTTAYAQEEDAEPMRILIDDGTIAQGVCVDAWDLSGLDAAQALELLNDQSAAKLDEAALALLLPEYTIEVPLSDLPVTAMLDTAVDKAMLIGRSGSIEERMAAIQQAKTEGTIIRIPYAYEEEAIQTAVSDIAADIPRETQTGSFTFDPSLPERFIIEEGCRGFTPDEAGMLHNVKAALDSGEIDGVEVPGTPAQDGGIEILAPGTAANTKLVGVGQTKVAGSSGRRTNIAIGADIINGTVVLPGETFSVNDTLGPRNGAAGIWRAAGAVLDGRHVTEYGGGLCQVATTLFNAVARADLRIVEWVHHTIPSTYVTIGCDATVSTGTVDFKFTNDTDWPIYIVYHYDDSTRLLTCEIWGRPLPDGQYIEITGKKVGSKGMPSTIYTEDPELIREGRSGKYSETYKIWYDADGTEISRELMDENLYPALAPIKLVPKPTQTPTPEGEGGGA